MASLTSNVTRSAYSIVECSQLGRSILVGPWGGFLAVMGVDVGGVATGFVTTVGLGIDFGSGLGAGGGVAGFDVDGPGEGLGVGPASFASLFKRTC